jgi:hypothetical protein|tara:strand:+ start:3065 stop:3190 length:126 start_codon:yes stop_codon:yes gene_type:complete
LSSILGNENVKEILFGLVGAVLGGLTTKYLTDKEELEEYED